MGSLTTGSPTGSLSSFGESGLNVQSGHSKDLVSLSLLPGDVTIRVLPGDKIYQAMEFEPEFMQPAILRKAPSLRNLLGSASRTSSLTH